MYQVQVIQTDFKEPWRFRVEIQAEDSATESVAFLFAGTKVGRSGRRQWTLLGCEVLAGKGAALDHASVARLASDWDARLSFARSALDWDQGQASRQTKAMQASGRGRRGLADDFFEGIAAQYRQLAARNPHPTAALAKDHGVARSTAARWVATARTKGMLGPAEAGKAGEAKTPVKGRKKR